jgi:RNA 2',3'-cyclic 3'-phosphodiesterase
LLDPAVRARLGDVIGELRPAATGVAWVVPDNLHLTLKFLGGVEEARLTAVIAALTRAAIGTPPFELAVTGLGAFPSPTRPRVLWAGIADGAERLTRLAADVDETLGSLDFAREDRPFSPHVTFGRVREPRRQPVLGGILAAAAARDFGRIRVTKLSLMRSDLSPRGARYSELGAIPLAGA